MSKPKAAGPQVRQAPQSGSGSYPALGVHDPGSTEIIDVEGQDSSVIGMQRDIWLRVTWWIGQLPSDDPRRRLLQLAELRRDARLADVLLRHL
jgi:hypothetical protein